VVLREEAEKRGKLIKEASERHAPPEEACKLIASYSQAEVKIADQLKTGHKNTEAMQTKVCSVAAQKLGVPAEINDIGDPAMKRWRE